MATLTQKTLKFNRKIKLSNDGGALSSDTGHLLIREFDEKINFSKTMKDYLTLQDERLYCTHKNINMLIQKIYQFASGYAEDDAADFLTNDPVFTKIIETEGLASQPSLSRLFLQFNQKSILNLQAANQQLVDNVHQYRNSKTVIFDLDSTHADTMVIKNLMPIMLTMGRWVFIQSLPSMV